MGMMKFIVEACLLMCCLACLGERCTGDSNTPAFFNDKDFGVKPDGMTDNGFNLEAVFNVNEFGAKPDGTTDNSKAFSAAWGVACSSNREIVRFVIPEGTYLTGPVIFGGPCKNVAKMIVQVRGVVKASTDMRKFPKPDWIVFQYLNGLMVTGGGVFDGQGRSSWPLNYCSDNSNCNQLPISIRFNFVTNSIVKSISSMDSKFFHMHVLACHNLNFQLLKISAPANSPNTDGIHIAKSTDISISTSVIGTGDDCISIGPGSSRIFIFNVMCGPGHGISIGSLGKTPNEGDVHTISVNKCTFSKTSNGLRIKTWPGSQANNVVSNFTCDNILMKDVRNPILIDQRYCPHTTCFHQPPSSVKISDISFKDVVGTSATKVAVKLACSERNPCRNIKLNNINLKYSAKGTPTIASCSNAIGSSSGIEVPSSCF